jgi:hypothetical protein
MKLIKKQIDSLREYHQEAADAGAYKGMMFMVFVIAACVALYKTM